MKHHTRKAMIRDSWDRTRPDILTAERIEVALQLQRMLDTPSALQYLLKHNVARHHALRVLTRPKARRARKGAIECRLASLLRHLLRNR
jgi:hypothetical protein